MYYAVSQLFAERAGAFCPCRPHASLTCDNAAAVHVYACLSLQNVQRRNVNTNRVNSALDAPAACAPLLRRPSMHGPAAPPDGSTARTARPGMLHRKPAQATTICLTAGRHAERSKHQVRLSKCCHCYKFHVRDAARDGCNLRALVCKQRRHQCSSGTVAWLGSRLLEFADTHPSQETVLHGT